MGVGLDQIRVPITLVLSTVLIWGFYGLLRRSPTRWWLWAWLACLPLIVLLVFVTPVLLEPLFNRFEPLVKTQQQLMAPIRRACLPVAASRSRTHGCSK